MNINEAITAAVPPTIYCPLCHQQHRYAMYFGMKFIGCPEVPEGCFVNWDEMRKAFSKTVHPLIKLTDEHGDPR